MTTTSEDAAGHPAKLAKAMEGEEREGSSDFGALLRRYRLAVGLSQEALAERARLSLYGISALERGYRRTPQRETLALLAGALALNEEQRQAFEAAAVRPSSPRHRTSASVTVGPWPSATIPTLPLALTSFIGREAELEEIGSLVREHRLATITGAGGVGKTQTALRVAIALSDSPDSGTRFVALAPIHDPTLVVAAIAGALGVQEVPNHTPIETVLAYLKNKALVLILDNCEHVIQEAATVADALLLGCPRIRILATSREPLRAAGERTYRLPSLTATDASALFADRAQAVDAHFNLTAENAAVIANLCQRLDGIPLAIELAAARANVLSLKTLALRMDDRFAVLTDGKRTALPRQQTMRAAIDWSYDLLSPLEQRAFERLSIFVGGCTLDAATTVCADGDIEAKDVFALLSSLVDKSLVVADLEGIEPRYRLLESFREYAREKLKVRGEEGATAHRHVHACHELTRVLYESFESDGDYAWRAMAQSELGNWRAALQWSLAERSEITSGQRLAGDLHRVWLSYAMHEGRRWLTLARDLVDERTPVEIIAQLLLADAYLANDWCERQTQLSLAEKATELYQSIGNDLGVAEAQAHVALVIARFGRTDEAVALLDAALATAQRFADDRLVVWMLRVLAGACNEGGDVAAARAHYARSAAIAESRGWEIAAARAICEGAECDFLAGDVQLAIDRASKALAVFRRRQRFENTALIQIAKYLVSLGRYDEARNVACESLDVAREDKDDVSTGEALVLIAEVVVLRSSESCTPSEALARAAQLFGFADARFAAIGFAPLDYDKSEQDRALAILRDVIGTDAVAELITKGAGMTQEQAVEEALAL